MSAAVRAVLSTVSYDLLGPERLNGRHLRRPKYDEWERLLFEEYRRERAELSQALQKWGRPWISTNRERLSVPEWALHSADAWARWMAGVIVSRCLLLDESAERSTLRSEFADALVPGHDRLRQERRVQNEERRWPTSFEALRREYDDGDEDSAPLDRMALEARAFEEPSSIEAMVERQALRNLSPQDRSVILLRTAFERHPGHLAQVSGWKPATARKRVQRARANLEARIETEWAEWAGWLWVAEQFLVKFARLYTSPPTPKPKAWNRPSLQSEVREIIQANGCTYKLTSSDRLTLKAAKREALDVLEKRRHAPPKDEDTYISWLPPIEQLKFQIPAVPLDAYQTYRPKELHAWLASDSFHPEELLMFGPYLHYGKDEMTLDTSRNGSGETLAFEGWEISRFRSYPNGRPEMWWRADNGGLPSVYARTPRLLLKGMKSRKRHVTFS